MLAHIDHLNVNTEIASTWTPQLLSCLRCLIHLSLLFLLQLFLTAVFQIEKFQIFIGSNLLNQIFHNLQGINIFHYSLPKLSSSSGSQLSGLKPLLHKLYSRPKYLKHIQMLNLSSHLKYFCTDLPLDLLTRLKFSSRYIGLEFTSHTPTLLHFTRLQ